MKYQVIDQRKYDDLTKKMEQNRQISENIKYYKIAALIAITASLEHFFDAKPLGLIGYVPAMYYLIKKVNADCQKNEYEKMLTYKIKS